MPIKQSAKKHLRQIKKHTARNLKITSDIKTLLKKIRQAIDAKEDIKKIQDQIKQAQKMIDEAVQKKVIKFNAGNRKKSRLLKYLNQGGRKIVEKVAKKATPPAETSNDQTPE